MVLTNLLNLQKKRLDLCRPLIYLDIHNVVLLGTNEEPRHLKRAVSDFVGVLFVAFGLFC